MTRGVLTQARLDQLRDAGWVDIPDGKEAAIALCWLAEREGIRIADCMYSRVTRKWRIKAKRVR